MPRGLSQRLSQSTISFRAPGGQASIALWLHEPCTAPAFHWRHPHAAGAGTIRT